MRCVTTSSRAVPGLATWIAAAAIAAGAAASLSGQLPPTYWQIPIVPGTVRDVQAEAQAQAGPNAANRAVRAFRVGASIEQIFRFYFLRLGGSPGDAPDSAAMAPTRRLPMSRLR